MRIVGYAILGRVRVALSLRGTGAQDGVQSVPLLASYLTWVRTAAALELQVLAYGVIEHSHARATPYCARVRSFCHYTPVSVPVATRRVSAGL
jgi:hypothetical protein